MLDDPTLVEGGSENGEAKNLSFGIRAEHPLFESVGKPNETDSDRAFLGDAPSETLATVGIEGEQTDGAVTAVDPESDSVLLGTIATHPAQREPDFTDAAARILGNAVLFGVETEPPVVDLSGLDIAGRRSNTLVTADTRDLTVTVSHVSGGAGECT